MFQTPEALNPNKHRSLKLSSAPDYRFAAQELVCPVVSGEMWHVAREYILVFSNRADALPLALMGTEAGVNAYVGDGNPPWWGRYVPAHLRRYPFVAAPIATSDGATADQQRFTVCIDSSAPQLSDVHGRALFDEDGTATDLLRQVEQALLSLQQDFAITQALVKQIDETGLLIDKALTIKPSQGEPVGLQGFRIIDQDRLRQASPDQLAGLIKTRALDLIYAHIGSLSNLQDGLLAKRARGEVQTASPVADLFELGEADSLSFDWSKMH